MLAAAITARKSDMIHACPPEIEMSHVAISGVKPPINTAGAW